MNLSQSINKGQSNVDSTNSTKSILLTYIECLNSGFAPAYEQMQMQYSATSSIKSLLFIPNTYTNVRNYYNSH